MTFLQNEADDLRMRMLREPRGYPALCCNLVLPPTIPEAQAGFVIVEQVEYPGMSGTNTIAVAMKKSATSRTVMRSSALLFFAIRFEILGRMMSVLWAVPITKRPTLISWLAVG